MFLKLSRLLAIFSLLFFQFACKRSKIQKSIAELPNKEISEYDSSSMADLPNRLFIDQSDFKYLKLKSKINFQSENLSQSFPANVHVKKDSVIWISISVGIEAARCVITQDSIKFMDRINRRYYVMSINDLSAHFNFDFNFNLLQSLLIGNLPIDRGENEEIELNSLYTSLFQMAKNVKIENQIDNVTHKLTTILAEDLGGKSNLGISYSDFLLIPSGQLIPHAMFAKIDVIKDGLLKTTTLNFRHTKFEYLEHELRFPYTVPKSFKKGKVLY